jgi:hypothetical protein
LVAKEKCDCDFIGYSAFDPQLFPEYSVNTLQECQVDNFSGKSIPETQIFPFSVHLQMKQKSQEAS